MPRPSSSRPCARSRSDTAWCIRRSNTAPKSGSHSRAVAREVMPALSPRFAVQMKDGAARWGRELDVWTGRGYRLGAGRAATRSLGMHRRTFVQAAVASLASRPWASLRGGRPGHLSRIGLELYSVRDAMRRDPERTLAAVRAMGYDDVELLWSLGNFGRTVAQVRAALDREGLRAPSAHVSPAILFVGWERSLDIAHRLGHEYLIVPNFTPDSARSLDDWREWADRFNAAGAGARRRSGRPTRASRRASVRCP